jgi:hypothetical protein
VTRRLFQELKFTKIEERGIGIITEGILRKSSKEI